MKLFTFLLLASIFSMNAQTTEREYTYFSKTYQEDLNTGRDIISGYKIELIGRYESMIKAVDNKESKNQLRSIKTYAVTREKDSTKAVLLVEFIRRDTGHTKFVCLPSTNSDKSLLNKSQNDFFALKTSIDAQYVADYHYLWNAICLIRNMCFSE